MQFSKTSIFHTDNISSAKHNNLRARSETDYFEWIEVHKPTILFIIFEIFTVLAQFPFSKNRTELYLQYK